MRDRRFVSRWSIAFLALAAIALGSILLPTRAQEPASGSKTRSPAELADARIKVARNALKELQTPNPSEELQNRIAVWLRRIAKTRHELGGPKDVMISEMKEYLDQVKQLEAYAVINLRAGRITSMDLREAEYKVLEAETWLALESQKSQ
jgi:hypothetical protein